MTKVKSKIDHICIIGFLAVLYKLKTKLMVTNTVWYLGITTKVHLCMAESTAYGWNEEK